MIQLVPNGGMEALASTEDPIQGWLSYRYGELKPSPTVASTATGPEARFVTLLYPSEDGSVPTVDGLVLDDDSIQLTVTANGSSDRIVVEGDGAQVSSIGP